LKNSNSAGDNSFALTYGKKPFLLGFFNKDRIIDIAKTIATNTKSGVNFIG